MPKLKITASKTIWQDVDILSIRILVLRDFLLLLCFGRLLVQRQRKEATQVLYCAALGIV